MYKVNFSTLGRLCSNRRITAIVEIIGHGIETEEYSTDSFNELREMLKDFFIATFSRFE